MNENAQDAFHFSGISKRLPGRFIDQDPHLSAHFNLIPPPVWFRFYCLLTILAMDTVSLSIPLSREWLDFSCAIPPFALTASVFVFVSPALK